MFHLKIQDREVYSKMQNTKNVSAKMSEKQIEQKLRADVKAMGGRAYKFVSPGNTGVPDRIVIMPGRIPIFVELKTDTGRLSPIQKAQIDYLERMGQDVRVLYGIKDVERFIDEIANT